MSVSSQSTLPKWKMKQGPRLHDRYITKWKRKKMLDHNMRIMDKMHMNKNIKVKWVNGK